jgi:hypothetical protein
LQDGNADYMLHRNHFLQCRVPSSHLPPLSPSPHLDPHLEPTPSSRGSGPCPNTGPDPRQRRHKHASLGSMLRKHASLETRVGGPRRLPREARFFWGPKKGVWEKEQEGVFVSSTYMFKNDVGPMYSHSKKNVFISFASQASWANTPPLCRHRFDTCMIYY